MELLRGSEIERGLTQATRVYLCGNLQRPCPISHIQTTGYEIGISDFKDYTFEKAHIHSQNREFNYVLNGEVKVFLLREKREEHFYPGDLYVICENEPYVGKAKAGTRIIFSKTPGGNDKVLVDMEEALLNWGKSWDAEYSEG